MTLLPSQKLGTGMFSSPHFELGEHFRRISSSYPSYISAVLQSHIDQQMSVCESAGYSTRTGAQPRDFRVRLLGSLEAFRTYRVIAELEEYRISRCWGGWCTHHCGVRESLITSEWNLVQRLGILARQNHSPATSRKSSQEPTSSGV